MSDELRAAAAAVDAAGAVVENAVRGLAEDGIDVLIVIGSKNSSNSNRLAELGARKGVASHLVDDASEI